MPLAADAPARWITLAALLRPQGRKGELLAELLSDFPERFSGSPRVFLAKPDFNGTPDEARAIAVESHWLPVGRNSGRIVLLFAGVTSIEAAEALVGLEVLVPIEERVQLEDDAEYISELLGCRVFDGDAEIGRVAEVEFPLTPDGTRRLPDAAPLLVVVNDAKEEMLIPFVQAFLVELAADRKQIRMRLPAGLVELNRASPRAGEDSDSEQEPKGL